jgi:hypothetical protein
VITVHYARGHSLTCVSVERTVRIDAARPLSQIGVHSCHGPEIRISTRAR